MSGGFIADVLIACCYLIGVLCLLAGLHAVILAAFRRPDRGMDPADPDVQKLAVDRARREGRR